MDGSSVLVVDSDSKTRNTLAFELKRLGYKVSSTSGGVKAFELFPKMPFDLVIANVEMPSGSGLELLKTFREKQIRIPILLTAAEPTPDEATLIQAGASGFFQKPIKPALVLEKVQKALKKAA